MHTRTHKIFLLAFVLPLAALSSCTKNGPLVWTDDYPAAVQQAQAAGKNVLLNFTGSDWCVNCFRLDDEVFSKPEFADYARSHYVLVTLDFPIKKELPEKTTKQNLDLQAKYAVINIPTLILLDAHEKQLAFVQGYRGEGVAGLLDELNDPAHHPIKAATSDAAPAPAAATASSTAK